MNIPIELMQARKTALTAWQLYNEICESGDREAIARALICANQCDQTSHEWFMRWQAVGGTSDIFSIAEREQENLAAVYVAEFQAAVPDSVLLRTNEPATAAAQTAASIGDLDLGTHVIISGGDVMELDAHLETQYGEQNGDIDLPF